MSSRNGRHGGGRRSLRIWLVFVFASLLAAGALLVAGCDDDPEPGTLEFGAVCTADNDCVSGLCRNVDSTSTTAPVKRCSATCSDTAPCASGTCSADSECVLGPPSPVEAGETLRVGYLYIGPVGDHGWTKSHDDGRAYMEAQLGDAIKVNTSPSIAPNDAPDEIERMITEEGDHVIIGTSFDFLASLQSAAPNHPDVTFLTCSGFEHGPNLGSYFGRMEQAMYLAGLAAGDATTTGFIGIVGPVIIPETIRLNNAFTLGVRESNPTATVVVEWINAWFDPAAEPVAVENLIQNFDCDVIYGHTDTQIPMGRVVELQDGNAANGELSDFSTTVTRVYTLGYDNADACNFSAEYCITSAYWNWGPMITHVIESIIDGTWLPSDEIYEQMQTDADDSVVFYSELNSAIVSSDAVAAIEAAVPRLASDDRAEQYFFWTGPINDQQGNECLAAGEIPTDDALLSMCWYTEGLIDTDSNPNVPPAGVCPGEYDCTNQ